MPQASMKVLLALILPLLAGGPAGAQEAPPRPLLLILDASGSMWGQIDGVNKIVIARDVLGDLVDDLPEGSEIGVIAYGHRREGDCDDIETVIPMGALSRDTVKQTVSSLNPKGKTPITRSVEQAFESLEGRSDGTTVILLSDGLETCGGDPCAAVRAAKQRGIHFVMHVIGFDVAGEDVSSLECAAQAGEGLFLSAENADELSGALERAVALPADVPAGRLSVRAVANGELQDAAVNVSWSETGEEAGGGRTYADPTTNPRLIPLPDGAFDVEVGAVGIKGDTRRRFTIEIVDGSLVEKEVDYSTGEVSIGVTRNGELSDAVFRLVVPGTGEQAVSGRTYTAVSSNPAKVRIVSGTYEASVGSVELADKPWVSLGEVTVDPQGHVEVSHDFASGTLRVGARRDGELVDATLKIVSATTGEAVGQGRTYTSPSSNPKAFLLAPGDYRVTVAEIRGERREITVTVVRGETVERMVDPSGGPGG